MQLVLYYIETACDFIIYFIKCPENSRHFLKICAVYPLLGTNMVLQIATEVSYLRELNSGYTAHIFLYVSSVIKLLDLDRKNYHKRCKFLAGCIFYELGCSHLCKLRLLSIPLAAITVAPLISLQDIAFLDEFFSFLAKNMDDCLFLSIHFFSFREVFNIWLIHCSIVCLM